MEVHQVLRMNGGLGEYSYANNSLPQRKAIYMTIPIIEEAMIELCSSTLPNNSISIADLGCSSGPNTLLLVTELVKIVYKQCKRLGYKLPEFQVQLNDLPCNDFNSIFRSLNPWLQDKLMQETGPGPELGSCFVSGVPGSFYGRIFPTKTLHFVHSSYSLMWLSKVPEGVEMNKDNNIYMDTRSPKWVVNAYHEQFQRDFGTFIKCRAEEVVAGGKMVLTILGRRNEDASRKDSCYVWELLATALKQMVTEGFIEEEKLHSFHIPQYMPSPAEVKMEVEKEGSFAIKRLESSEIKWIDCFGTSGLSVNDNDGAYNMTKCMRSVAEPLLVQHFGEFVIDELFDKYKTILSRSMSEEESKFVNVTVSMTRQG